MAAPQTLFVKAIVLYAVYRCGRGAGWFAWRASFQYTARAFRPAGRVPAFATHQFVTILADRLELGRRVAIIDLAAKAMSNLGEDDIAADDRPQGE